MNKTYIVAHYLDEFTRGKAFWTGYKWSPEASDAIDFKTFEKARACWSFVVDKALAELCIIIENYGLEDEKVVL